MAGNSPSPVVQRRRLRTELRKARQDAGLTQEQVADAMDWSLSKMIRIEAGTVGISTTDLKALLNHYQIDNPDLTSQLVALARAARERSWWSVYRDSRPLGSCSSSGTRRPHTSSGTSKHCWFLVSFRPRTMPALVVIPRRGSHRRSGEHLSGNPHEAPRTTGPG